MSPVSPAAPPFAVPRLPWPMPAVLAWGGGWLGWRLAAAGGLPPGWAWALGAALALALALPNRGAWRRLIAAAGFPLSSLAAGAAAAPPAWAWLLLALPLALLYPLRAWRDAPFFPTARGALQGLDAIVQPAPARVLDAGCGLGHGLGELRRLWPQARLQGLEWSRPLAWLAARRVPGAQVSRGDMWATPWGGADLIYLFQRPESMARAWAKAEREAAPGTWFVSLEFACPEATPVAVLRDGRRRPVWVYRTGAATAAPARGGPHSMKPAPGR